MRDMPPHVIFRRLITPCRLISHFHCHTRLPCQLVIVTAFRHASIITLTVIILFMSLSYFFVAMPSLFFFFFIFIRRVMREEILVLMLCAADVDVARRGA